ncbi:MAG: hypothetical protein ACLUVV_03860 [Christensenellales bacterium]
MSQQGGSFSAQTKEELLHTVPAHDGCIRAEMAAVIQACGSLVLTQRGLHLELISDHPALVRRMFVIVRNDRAKRPAFGSAK